MNAPNKKRSHPLRDGSMHSRGTTLLDLQRTSAPQIRLVGGQHHRVLITGINPGRTYLAVPFGGRLRRDFRRRRLRPAPTIPDSLEQQITPTRLHQCRCGNYAISEGDVKQAAGCGGPGTGRNGEYRGVTLGRRRLSPRRRCQRIERIGPRAARRGCKA